MSTQPPSQSHDETPEIERLIAAISPGLAEEFGRILARHRERWLAEAEVRLKKALIDKEAQLREASQADQERVRAEAAEQVRHDLTQELESRFGEKLSAELRALKERLDSAASEAEAGWERERAGLSAEAVRWRVLADFYRRTGTVISQADILGRFLKAGRHYASALTVYLNKPDGLRRWVDDDEGAVAFPDLVSEGTRDPDWYWTPVKVRSRVVLAVAATEVRDAEALDALVAALQRSIENLGLRLGARASELATDPSRRESTRPVG